MKNFEKKKYYFVAVAENYEVLCEDWVDFSKTDPNEFISHIYDTYEPKWLTFYNDETCEKEVGEY